MALAALGKLNLEEAPPIWGSRSVDCFEKIKLISHGTYGEVYMAKEIETGEIVALKKIRTNDEREGFPVTAIREIKILKKLHHRNVINLKEVVYSPCPDNDDQRDDNNKYKGEIYMVFEYMDHDLAGLAYRPGTRFTAPHIKCCMKQLLTGLHYCHVKHVLHRDIKGSNLLIDKKGNLKLADFTLARTLSLEFTGTLTNQVTTLWYRAPELLLGATEYGPAVDMWSVACLFAELLNGEPIFPGKTEIDQLKKIYELCGSPDENNWPGVSEMPLYERFKPSLPLKSRVIETYGHFDAHALELLECMLVLDPPKRISAKDALDSDYFWSEPLPCEPKSLPTYESSHEFRTKKMRQQMRHNEEAAKKQKLQHPQQQQGGGQSHAAPHWPSGPNHSINNVVTYCHHNYPLVDLAATTTIKSNVVVVHLVQTGTHLAQTSPVVIIIRAVKVIAADHILHKVEVHHMAQVLAVAMVLDHHLTTHKVVVSTVALEEVRTQLVVLETNNMDGN
ncbi:unnamed protein product, partial [Brassica oleracea]